MTLVQLEYIVALDKYRHFSKASKKCFITQPTLSMQINKLEKELGIVLFDRSKQPVVPTEAGKVIIAQARTVLQEAAKIHNMIDLMKDELTGELHIGIIPTLAPYLLPLFVTEFIQKYDQIKLIVEELQSEEIISRLKNETLDAGILVTPIQEPGIEEHPLFYEAFVAYISKKHPLFTKKNIAPSDLNVEELWLLNQGHCFRNQMINICSDRKMKRPEMNFEYESGSLDTLRRLVEKENGITLLPELAIADVPEDHKNRIKQFAEPRPQREVSIVVHRSLLKKQLIDLLKVAIIDAIPDHMKEKNGNVVKWR